jgi:hypothetical protein
MDDIKHIIDGASVLAALGALVGALPVIAAALSIVWTLIRICETRTVQGWIHGKKRK